MKKKKAGFINSNKILYSLIKDKYIVLDVYDNVNKSKKDEDNENKYSINKVINLSNL